MSKLDRKVVVITGASSGIGAASAIKFAKHGCRLVLNGRNEQALNEVAKSCVEEGISPEDIVLVRGDLNDDSTVNNIIKTTLERFGTIHILFNNAVSFFPGLGALSVDGTADCLDYMYRLILRVTYVLIQGFVKELCENKGVIINCSSGYSVVAEPSRTAYCVMKAALDQFTKILAVELGMKGVRVNSINPGFVKTGISRRMGDKVDDYYADRSKSIPLEQKLSSADEIADVVLFLASQESSSITGTNVFCDRGVTLTSAFVDFKQYK